MVIKIKKTERKNQKKSLYAYTYPEAYKKNQIKVGDSYSDLVHRRIKTQTFTGSPSRPLKKIYGELPLGKRDTSVHELMLKYDKCIPVNTIEEDVGEEWFQVPAEFEPFDFVERCYNELKFGVARSKSYKKRKEQTQAIQSALQWFNQTSKKSKYKNLPYRSRFLLNAKMRFGKCFTSLHIAEALKFKKVLIITLKPDVIAEWIDTANNHIDFHEWKGIKARKVSASDRENNLADIDFNKILKDYKVALCASIQDLQLDNNKNVKKRLEIILKTKWDLIIFDEVHYGSSSPKTEEILSKIKYGKRLDLSGTPFKLLEQEDLATEQVFSYSYIDEQANKREEKRINNSRKPLTYNVLPDMNICAIDISNEEIQRQIDIFRTNEIDFSLNELFKTENANFKHVDAVSHFLESLWDRKHSSTPQSVYGKLADKLACPAIRHSIWWLDRVESAQSLENVLIAHPYFKDFTIIDATGGTKQINNKIKHAKTKKELIGHINHSSKKGSITITCGRFLTGITIKEWDSILVLNDTKSAEAYFQAIFRIQSPWIEEDKIIKHQAWVFDFSINRTLEIVYDSARSLNDNKSLSLKKYNNIDQTINILCQDLKVRRFLEGSFKSYDTSSKDIFDILQHGSSKSTLARRITSNLLVGFENLTKIETHPEIISILERIKGYKTLRSTSLKKNVLLKIGNQSKTLQELKNSISMDNDTKIRKIQEFANSGKDKQIKAHKLWVATQIKRLAICLSDFIYMTYEREYNIDDVVKMKSSSFFKQVTGISKDDFMKMCELGLISEKNLNIIVRDFYNQETSSLEPELFIYENLIEKDAA